MFGNLQRMMKWLHRVQVDKVKDEMARMLAEWLYKDFGLLIEPPTKEEIAKNLEEHDGRD